jgi:pyruvate,water dikinase
VLFTANPVTSARDEVVVEASPGLGEAVVSGLVTADHFTVKQRFRGWRIVRRRLGRREVIIKARRGGGTERVERPTSTVTPALPDKALLRLASMGKAIEHHFGAPQDVEWAWDGKKLYIVQARPITALPEPPPQSSLPMQVLAGLITELLPDRPYPLEATTWLPTVFGFPIQFGAVLGLRFLPPDQLFVEEDGVVVRLKSHPPARPTLGILLAPVRLLRLARRYDPAQWSADPLIGKVQARVRALESRDVRAISWDRLLAMVREALGIPALIWKFRVRYLVGPMLAMARLRLLLALTGRSDLFGTLVFTGIETRTLDANRAIEALAARIRSDPTLADTVANHEAQELWTVLEKLPTGRSFLDELRAFLDEYGHREVGGTLQVSQPTWKEAPEVVLGMLQGIARTEPRPQPQTQPAWEAARDAVLTHPLMRLRPLRSAFLKLLAAARYFPKLREDTRFYFMKPLPVLRRTLLELGRRLTEFGALDATEDVFHLKLGELERITGGWPPSAEVVTELKALVALRKAKRIELEGTPLVDPRLFGHSDEGEPEGDALVRGLPGSPGLAEGPVCVIHDGSQFGKLQAGDVLVAPYTNPAWTPLFERASAVVVDSGGPLSHAAIVAREYRIPAVMGTVEGTRRLRDGLRVRVDGNRGTVIAAEASITEQVG